MAINYGLNKGIDAALPKGQGAWSEAGRGVASTLSGAASGYAAAGPIGAVTGAVMNPVADLAGSVGDIRESHANAAANRAVPQAPVSKDFGGYRDAEAQATAAKMKATRGAAAFAPAAPSPAPLPKMDYLNKPNPFAQPAAAAPAAAAAPPAGMTMPGTPWKPIQDPASQFNGPAESSVDNGWVTTGRHDMARIQGKYGTPGSAVGTVSYNKPANPNQPAVKAAAINSAIPVIGAGIGALINREDPGKGALQGLGTGVGASAGSELLGYAGLRKLHTSNSIPSLKRNTMIYLLSNLAGLIGGGVAGNSITNHMLKPKKPLPPAQPPVTKSALDIRWLKRLRNPATPENLARSVPFLGKGLSRDIRAERMSWEKPDTSVYDLVKSVGRENRRGIFALMDKNAPPSFSSASLTPGKAFRDAVNYGLDSTEKWVGSPFMRSGVINVVSKIHPQRTHWMRRAEIDNMLSSAPPEEIRMAVDGVRKQLKPYMRASYALDAGGIIAKLLKSASTTTSMTSTQPAFVESFVKRCCDLGLSEDATVILLDTAQQDEIYNHPSYVEGWNKVAGMAKVIGTVGKGLDWIGNKAIKPLFKTPLRAGLTLGIPTAAGGGVLGARAWNDWEPFSNNAIGKAFKDLPVGVPGASSGGAGGSGGGAYSTTNPFDYIQRASGGSSFGTGGGSGGSGGAGGHPGIGQLQTLKQQKLNIDAQKSQYMKDLSAAMADPARFSEVPRMRRQLAQFDTQSNAVARQMSGLTGSLTAEQNKMHGDAQQGLRAVQSLAPQVQGKYDKYTNLADGGGNAFSRWWAGGDAKIRQRQQEAADMLQALNAREKTLRTAGATNFVD